MTEELEESQSTSLYEDYKFLTPLDLEKLNASHLVGTSTLKAYMHGYFMDLKAYQKLFSAVNPFAYDKYKKQKIVDRIEKQGRERIVPQTKAKFNVDYVKELQNRKKKNKQSKEKVENSEALLND